jgi:hypothetical protein
MGNLGGRAQIERCGYCGAIATHFCDVCGKWICDSKFCEMRAEGRAVVHHPVRTAQVVGSKILGSVRRL